MVKIFRRPSEVRPRQIGTTTFATGRARLNESMPSPTCRHGMSRHARHEMREHRGRY